MSGAAARLNPKSFDDAFVHKVYMDMGGNSIFQKYEDLVRPKVQAVDRADLIKATLTQGVQTEARLEGGASVQDKPINEKAFMYAISTAGAVVNTFTALEDIIRRHPNPSGESYEGLMSYHEELIPQRHAVMKSVFEQAIRLEAKFQAVQQEDMIVETSTTTQDAPVPMIGKPRRTRVRASTPSDDEEGESVISKGKGSRRKTRNSSGLRLEFSYDEGRPYNLRERSGQSLKEDSTSSDERDDFEAKPLTQERREEINARKIKAEDSGEVVVLDD